MTTEKRIIEWAAERGILEHGTATGQTLKLLSEVGELADGILTENSALILDALGDVGVCVVIVAHMHQLEIEDLQRYAARVTCLDEAMLHITLHAGLLADGVAKGEQQVIQAQLGAVWSWINAMAAHLHWSFGDALYVAWQTISTRRGAMGPNGTWLKE
jgi:hypothetical protein